MANGKFSQPRNRFQEPENEGMPRYTARQTQPCAPAQHNAPEQGNKFARKSVREDSCDEAPLFDPEDEAIDQAFAQVSEPRSGWLDSLGALFGKNRKLILICSGCVALAIVLAIAGIVIFGRVSDPYDGKILNNVTIAGIHVGGLTRSQAEDVIRSATQSTFTQQDMILFLPDTTLRFSPKDTGARLDVDAVVKAAFQYGRTGSQQQREAAYQASLTGNHIIALLPYLELNTEYIYQQIQTYADSFGSAYSEPTYYLEGTRPELNQDLFDPNAPCQTLYITLGTPGLGLDVEQVYEAVLDAYSFNTFQVEMADMPDSSTPPPPDIPKIYEELYIAPVNATMNQQTFEPIPGSYGYGFDQAKAQQLVSQADYGETVSIPMEYIDPAVQEDNLLFQDVLGSCETPFSNNPKRTHNLTRVCELLNGLVLNPGEEFSYNNSVGERTTARGFQAAPAYSGTKLVDSVGGGVCQGSSTLYYCALMADMEITDRINHGFPVSYIPMGMDATVNWGGPDFRFRNSSNYPIRIEAEVSDGFMRMRIMGTEERDYYVKLEYEVTRVITPEIVIEEHDSDSGYTDGQVLEAGCNGYHIRTYKCKYSRETDQLISRDFIVLSAYMSERRVIVKIIDEEPPEEETTEPTDPTDPTDTTTDPTDPSQGSGSGDGGSGSGDGGSGGGDGGSGSGDGGSGGGDGGSGGGDGGSGGGDGGSGGGDGGSGGGDGGSGGGDGGSGGGDGGTE